MQGRQAYHYPNSDQYNFRMTYSDVNDILAGDEERLKPLRKLSQVFIKWPPCARLSMRIRRGALNFDTNEAKILVNKEENWSISVLRQRIAERMIGVLYADCQ